MLKETALFLLSLSILSPVSTNATSNVDRCFDFADYTLDTQTIAAGDLIEKITKTNVIESERKYLNGLGKYDLSYSLNPNKSNVKTANLDNKTYVIAQEFDYSANGSVYTWIPDYITFNGYNYHFSIIDDDYRVEFENNIGESASFEIFYRLNIRLNKDKLNELFNVTYNDAKIESKKIDNNILLETKYNEDLLKYQKYCTEYEEYLKAKEVYEQYLEDLDEYNLKKEKYELDVFNRERLIKENAQYEQYLSDLKEYESNLEKYNQYLVDLDYYNSHYEKNLEDYLFYSERIKSVNHWLDIMKIPYIPMKLLTEDETRTMFGSITGSTVLDVISRKSEITTLGVSSYLIDECEQAYKIVKVDLEEYNAKKTDKEKYIFYRSKYNEIFNQTYALLRIMDKIYRSGAIASTIAEKGKTEQFLLLLAQLAYFVNALSKSGVSIFNYEGYNTTTGRGSLLTPGSEIIDEKWKVGGYTYPKILYSIDLLDTSFGGQPTIESYPDPVELLIPPEKIDEPIKPKKVEKPDPVPEIGLPPVKPTDVSKPIEPKPVSKPIEPKYQVIDENKLLIVDDYRRNLLFPRKDLSTDFNFEIYDSTRIQISEKMINVAIFHDYLGKIISSEFFTYGVEYTKPLPVKPGDTFYTDFIFDNWVDDKGNDIDLETLNVSKNLYPKYHGDNPQKYKVTWNLGDKTIEELVIAGSIPVVPEIPYKTSTDKKYYVFDKFDKEISEVVCDISYTALFTEINRYKITFAVDGKFYSDIYNEGEIPIPPSPDILVKPETKDHFYKFLGFDKEIKPATQDETYIALFETGNYFYISWVIDGKVFEERYKEGEVITYKGEMPSKEGDEKTYYVFDGWDHDYKDVVVHKNDTYIAKLTEHHMYTVKFVLNDKIITQEVSDEEIPIPPEEIPNYADLNYEYTFNRFDKFIRKPTSNETYTALYSKTNLIVDNFGKNGNVSIQDDTLIIDVSNFNNDSVCLDKFSQYFSDFNLSCQNVEILFKHGILNMSLIQLKTLFKRGLSTIGINYSKLSSNVSTISIFATDVNGLAIDSTDIEIMVEYRGGFADKNSKLFLKNEERKADFINGIIYSFLKINEIYDIKQFFNVVIENNFAVKYTIENDYFEPGETVHISYNCIDGYEISSLLITDKNGTKVTISDNGDFLMPESDVKIVFITKKISYQIRFFIDDELLCTKTAYYGDKIEPPTEVYKPNDEEYIYTFDSWNEEVTAVTENKDYYAIFTKTPIQKIEQKNTWVFPVVITFIVITPCILIGLLIIIIKVFLKRRKHIQSKN